MFRLKELFGKAYVIKRSAIAGCCYVGWGLDTSRVCTDERREALDEGDMLYTFISDLRKIVAHGERRGDRPPTSFVLQSRETSVRSRPLKLSKITLLTLSRSRLLRIDRGT